MKNKKGFTLIELLAVIVILGILAVIATVATSGIIEGARKDTYVANANAAISAARNDYLINNPTKYKWTLAEINALMEKKLTNTPFGVAYAEGSYVVRAQDGSFGVCLAGSTAAAGAIPLTSEATLAKTRVVLTATTCTAPDAQPATIENATIS